MVLHAKLNLSFVGQQNIHTHRAVQPWCSVDLDELFRSKGGEYFDQFVS